ncbi:RelA/SpoT family protein [Thioflexithrix psekupsensis]|uniref:GTP pyrophosphokinase n=1 Tax=Thioflexithrix psekupsensis TaxID=1570016 RepID=A0A251XCW4_9GAMM|nr:bifunctional (p)ppGpp synthetase/guanosine-3',5'-bis(diphosphate) 3'-pyrophosphohydrolase [Thioflexithrix psekupsensis]OUD16215.1 GTP diphosphokinase [Thioflexithrix psekupsensis]
MVQVKDPLFEPGHTGHLQTETWLARISQNLSFEEQAAIHNAYLFAAECHQDSTRPSGELYLLHVLTVADILADLGMETDVLIAAILHESVMNQLTTLEVIEKRFGRSVAALTKGVAKMRFVDSLNENITQAQTQQRESLRRMLLAMVKDVRVMLIILADRLHDMRVIKFMPEHEQLRLARETQELFAPLANRLGIGQIKWELEDLSMRYLQPEIYQQMAKLLDERRLDRENYINAITQRLSEALEKHQIKAVVTGRPKHIYSIWRKMQRKNLEFEQIFDVRAVRVIVDTDTECYRVLGIVHNMWRPIPHEFDDYIASPKNNDYRSLHTAVFGPDDKCFEVQIRTHDMHHHAEFGVAAHWRYKESNLATDDNFAQKISWLRQIPQWKEEASNTNDFLERVQSEIFEERVYALTPKGEIIDLPNGATVLDFAYYIHTELGHRCCGAKINGHIVPLTYQLKNGDRVQILRSNHNEEPRRDWLNPDLGFLKTSRARAKVKRWLRKLGMPQHIQAGRQTLERELKRLNLLDVNLEQLAQKFKAESLDQFLATIGRGEITPQQIGRSFTREILAPHHDIDDEQEIVQQPTPTHSSQGVSIEGVDGLMTELARCCRPLPGDPIIGYTSKGRGVVIHRQDCPNVLQWQSEQNERLIAVEWGKTSSNELYAMDIEVLASERKGLLADITTLAANEDINIIAANTLSNKKESTARMVFTIEVNSVNQASCFLTKIDGLRNVMSARRINH